jgi:dihydrofolate reductase
MNVIVAVCVGERAGGIGYKGGIPWVLPTDLLRFRKLTMGEGKNAVVMGRCTWESLPAKLRGRRNVVVSASVCDEGSKSGRGVEGCRRSDGSVPDAVYGSLDEAWRGLKASEAGEAASEAGIDDVWIIGGERLYAEALKHPNVAWVYRTVVHADKMCDRFFPELIYLPGFRLVDMSDEQKEGMYTFHYELWRGPGGARMNAGK